MIDRRLGSAADCLSQLNEGLFGKEAYTECAERYPANNASEVYKIFEISISIFRGSRAKVDTAKRLKVEKVGDGRTIA